MSTTANMGDNMHLDFSALFSFDPPGVHAPNINMASSSMTPMQNLNELPFEFFDNNLYHSSPAYRALADQYRRLKSQVSELNNRAQRDQQIIGQLNHVIANITSALPQQPSVSQSPPAPLIPEFPDIPAGLNPVLTVALLVNKLAPKNAEPAGERPEMVVHQFRSGFSDYMKWKREQKEMNHTPARHGYVTGFDGEYVGDKALEGASSTLRAIFSFLFSVYLDPDTFGNISDIAWEYVKARMYHTYPYFELCEGDWKLHKFATDKYGDWHRVDGPWLSCKRNPLIPVPLPRMGDSAQNSVVADVKPKREREHSPIGDDGDENSSAKRRKKEKRERREKQRKEKKERKEKSLSSVTESTLSSSAPDLTASLHAPSSARAQAPPAPPEIQPALSTPPLQSPAQLPACIGEIESSSVTFSLPSQSDEPGLSSCQPASSPFQLSQSSASSQSASSLPGQPVSSSHHQSVSSLHHQSASSMEHQNASTAQHDLSLQRLPTGSSTITANQPTLATSLVLSKPQHLPSPTRQPAPSLFTLSARQSRPLSVDPAPPLVPTQPKSLSVPLRMTTFGFTSASDPLYSQSTSPGTLSFLHRASPALDSLPAETAKDPVANTNTPATNGMLSTDFVMASGSSSLSSDGLSKSPTIGLTPDSKDVPSSGTSTPLSELELPLTQPDGLSDQGTGPPATRLLTAAAALSSEPRVIPTAPSQSPITPPPRDAPSNDSNPSTQPTEARKTAPNVSEPQEHDSAPPRLRSRRTNLLANLNIPPPASEVRATTPPIESTTTKKKKGSGKSEDVVGGEGVAGGADGGDSAGASEGGKEKPKAKGKGKKRDPDADYETVAEKHKYTPRSLYLADYIERNGPVLKKDFKAIWDNAKKDKAIKKEYENKSAEAKKAEAATSSLA